MPRRRRRPLPYAKRPRPGVLVRARLLISKTATVLRQVPRRVWILLPALGLLLGLLLNITVDVPEFIERWIRTPSPGDAISPPLLPFSPADTSAGEVLVVVVSFTGSEGDAAATRIYRSLHDRALASHLENVRVEWLGGPPPRISVDARRLGEKLNATLVIWGTADSHGIEPHYEVVSHSSEIRVSPDLGLTIAGDLPTFNAYVVNGLQNEFEYLLLATLGQLAFFDGDYVKARTILNEAIAVDLQDRARELELEAVFYYRGVIFKYLGDPEAAIADFTRGLEIDPDNSPLLQARGTASFESGDILAAIDDFSKAIAADPTSVAARLNRSTAYQYQGNFAQAEADVDTVLRLDPGNIMAMNNLASIRVSQGKHLEAIALLDQALRRAQDPSVKVAFLINRSVARRQLPDFDSALSDLDEAIQIAPKDPDALTERGVTLLMMGNPQAALENLAEALRLNPNYVPALLAKARAQIDFGTPENALEALNRAIESYHNNPVGYYTRDLYVVLGPTDWSPSYAQALYFPDIENAYYERAWAHHNLQDYESAISDFSRALTTNPMFTWAYYGRGYSYFEKGEFALSISDLDHFIGIIPTHAPAYYVRGYSYWSIGEMAKAFEDATKAIGLDPEFANPYYLRAIVNDEYGETLRAIDDYRTFLELATWKDSATAYARQRIADEGQ